MTGRPPLTCDEIRDLAPLYVTGALDPDEMDAVRVHLADCEDAHAELRALGEASAALLEAVEPAEPPASLKGRLMAAAQADLAEGRHPSTASGSSTLAEVAPVPAAEAVQTTAIVEPTPPGRVVDLAVERARRRSRIGWLVAAAAIVVAVALGASNLALRQDLSAAQAYRAGVDRALQLAAQPGSVTAVLASEGGTASGIGVVGADGTVQLAMRGLPPTSGSQVYAAWSVEVEQAPVNIGEFRVGADGVAVATAQAPTAAAGSVLALTLERSSGATTPTPPIVAAGVTRNPAG